METVKLDRQGQAEVLAVLAAKYPDVKSGLRFCNPYQLFVATVLSAQTTDEQVNRATEKLFEAVPDIFSLAGMKPEELEPYIITLGLFRHKSRYLVEAARMIVEKYNAEIPADFNELIKLPGVGRKTANVIISNAFNQPAIAVDTHVFRVSKRLGLAVGGKVELVEEELKEAVPRCDWSATHHRLITHGRQVCHARSPGCGRCFFEHLCLYRKETKAAAERR